MPVLWTFLQNWSSRFSLASQRKQNTHIQTFSKLLRGSTLFNPPQFTSDIAKDYKLNLDCDDDDSLIRHVH